ncbi:MAG: MCE family protein [Proteobacteria bacterium]|nr:MCE family protein [Pseudomonadota bacterium]
MIGFLFAFLIWLAKVDIDREYVEYDIYFEESVAGLLKASNVQYNGIPVGKVLSISIAPDDPSKVLVHIRIDSDVPILVDSVAVLSMQGLTGVLIVQIEGGSPDSEHLLPGDEEERAVIASRVSPIQELFVGGPDLINEAIITVGRLNKLLGDENLANIAAVLENAENLSGALAAQSGNFERIFSDLQFALVDLRRAAVAAERVASKTSELLADDVKVAMGGLRDLLTTANSLAENLDGVVGDNRAAVTAFASGTLPEISRLVVDMRRLAIAVSQLAEKLEANPSELIFGTPRPEYKTE